VLNRQRLPEKTVLWVKGRRYASIQRTWELGTLQGLKLQQQLKTFHIHKLQMKNIPNNNNGSYLY